MQFLPNKGIKLFKNEIKQNLHGTVGMNIMDLEDEKTNFVFSCKFKLTLCRF